MANTANDLAKDVALELNVTDPATELSAEILEIFKRRSTQVHAQLRVINVCYWDENDIPNEVYVPLVLYLAACSAKGFGKTVVDGGLDEARTREARLEALKTAALPRYSGAKLKSDYPVRSSSRFNFTTG